MTADPVTTDPDGFSLIERGAAGPVQQLLVAFADIAGLAELDLWLWDHQYGTLIALDGERTSDPDLDGWVSSFDLAEPVVFQGDPLGLLTARRTVPDDESRQRLASFAGLVATALRAGQTTSDTTHRVRRRRSMSLPAEMQWSLLPPTRFVTAGAEISAAVEPAYETGGDVFDYAVHDHRLWIALLDARGHGLGAAVTATVATAALRRARRQGADLETIAREIGRSVAAFSAPDDFVCALLAEIDLRTWEGRWLSAGHIAPMVAGPEGITDLEVTPALPLGLTVGGRTSEPVTKPLLLRPDQHLVMFSDGVIENVGLDATSPLGADLVRSALQRRLAGPPSSSPHHNVARGVIEDLLVHTGPTLRDDATLLILHRGDRLG